MAKRLSTRPASIRARIRRQSPEIKATEKIAAARYMKNPSARLRHLKDAAKQRAVLKGIAFEAAAFRPFTDKPPETCSCCGGRIDYSTGSGQKSSSPSVDRVDNTKGYIEGNLDVVCWACNRMKSDMSVADILRLLAYVAKPRALRRII